MTRNRLSAFTAISLFTIPTSSLPAQQVSDVSLSRAEAILHSPPLLLPGLPIVHVHALPCEYSCPDSMIEIEQVFDSTTHVTMLEWWVGPATRRSGWLERCRHDLRNPDRALDLYACPEPQPQAVIHGVWVEIRGALRSRDLARLLDQLAPPTQGS